MIIHTYIGYVKKQCYTMAEKYKGNPFKKTILLSPLDVLDKAIRNSLKLSLPRIRADRFRKEKIWILNRISYIRQTLTSNFRNYLRSIPNLNAIHEFYRTPINVYSSIDEFKKALGRIAGAIRVIEKFSDEYSRNIQGIRKNPYLPEKVFINHIHRLWKQYIARLDSFIREINDAFVYVNSIVSRLKKLPDYDPDLKTIVVCGPPNSGKSSLVGKLSRAKVQIAEYPFTTKNLVFGHIEIKTNPRRVIQIVDTPGLFDRPISKRKEEELLALEAIRTIADGIVFLFDCSFERTLEAPQQIQIYREVTKFLRTNIIVGLNKIDIIDNELYNEIHSFLINEAKIEPIPLSVKLGVGLDRILRAIQQLFGGDP